MPYPYIDHQGNELPGPETQGSEEMRSKVPEMYTKGQAPAVCTVGQLVAQLSRLPPEMQLSADGYDQFRVVVYNSQDDMLRRMHCLVEEAE